MRIQFYPSKELEEQLNGEAEKLGINVSTLVNDLLNKNYGLIPATSLSGAELRKKIIDEIADFVGKQPPEKEFDLNEASETYRHIERVYAGKPSSVKAQIGKFFNNKLVGSAPFANVEQVKINGKPKRTVSNRAAIYKVK